MGDKVVVIDCGSRLTKVGFAGESVPKSIFPTLYGKAGSGNDHYVGKEAQEKKSALNLTWPVNLGITDNFDQLERIFEHIYERELAVKPDKYPVLLTEPPVCPDAMREKMAKIMFDKFNVPALAFASQTKLTLSLSNLNTGVVLDTIDDVSFSAALRDGKTLPHASQRTCVGASAVTDYMSRVLGDYDPKIGRDEIKAMKKKYCYVATEDGEPIVVSHQLSDGRVIQLGSQRTQVYEILFNPSIGGINAKGIQEILHESVSKADDDIRPYLYANVVLTGGASTTEGFTERVKKEITALAPAGTAINISLSPDPANSAWRAGSNLASQPAFQDIVVTRKQFQEAGPSAVNNKCFK